MNVTYHHPSSVRSRAAAGFSLIEIIIAITIVGIMAATAVSMLKGNIDDAREKSAMADIDAMSTQLIVYEGRAGRPPTTEQGIKALWEKPTSEPIPDRWIALMTEEKKDPWGFPYKYEYPPKRSKKSYDIWSVGPDGQDGTEDDIGNFKNTAAAAK